MVKYLIDEILAHEKAFSQAVTDEQRIAESVAIGESIFKFLDLLEEELKALIPLADSVRIWEKENIGTAEIPEKMAYANAPTISLIQASKEQRKVIDAYLYKQIDTASFMKAMSDMHAFDNPVPIELLRLLVEEYFDMRIGLVRATSGKMPKVLPSPGPEEAEFKEIGARLPTVRGRGVPAKALPEGMRIINERLVLKGDTKSILRASRSLTYAGARKNDIHHIIDAIIYIDQKCDQWVDRMFGGPIPGASSGRLTQTFYRHLTFFLYESTPVHDHYYKLAGDKKKKKFTTFNMLEPIDRPMTSSYAFDPSVVARRYAELVAQIMSGSVFSGIQKKPYDFDFLINPRKYRSPISWAYLGSKKTRERFSYRIAREERTTFAAMRTVLFGMMNGLVPTADGLASADKLKDFMPGGIPVEMRYVLGHVFDLLMPHHEIYQTFTMELLELIGEMSGYQEQMERTEKQVARFMGYGEGLQFARLYGMGLFKNTDTAEWIRTASAENLYIFMGNELKLSRYELLAMYLFPGEGLLSDYINDLKKTNQYNVIRNTFRPGFVREKRVYIIDRNTGLKTEEYDIERRFYPNVMFMWMQHIVKNLNSYDPPVKHSKLGIERYSHRGESLWDGDRIMIEKTQPTVVTLKYDPGEQGMVYERILQEGKEEPPEWKLVPPPRVPPVYRQEVRPAEMPIPPFSFTKVKAVNPKTGDKANVVHRTFYNKMKLNNGRSTITDFQMMMLIQANNIRELDLGTMANPKEANLNRLSERLLYTTDESGKRVINRENLEIFSKLMDDRFTPADIAGAAERNRLEQFNEVMTGHYEDLAGEGMGTEGILSEIARRMKDDGYDIGEMMRLQDALLRDEMETVPSPDEDEDEPDDDEQLDSGVYDEDDLEELGNDFDIKLPEDFDFTALMGKLSDSELSVAKRLKMARDAQTKIMMANPYAALEIIKEQDITNPPLFAAIPHQDPRRQAQTELYKHELRDKLILMFKGKLSPAIFRPEPVEVRPVAIEPDEPEKAEEISSSEWDSIMDRKRRAVRAWIRKTFGKSEKKLRRYIKEIKELGENKDG